MAKADPGNMFRPNAGVAVLDLDDRVLAFRRVGSGDSWQLPQGGIDSEELPVEAMWRELEEETGIGQSLVDLVGEVPEWLGYEIPARFRSPKRLSRGQVQKWFIVRVGTDRIGEVEQILGSLPPEEFDDWKWTTMRDLLDEVVAFRVPVYTRLAAVLQGLEPGLYR
ncbi:MAG: RNA pyrophosphohydrolase [Acidimicrobiales bacterium]